MNIHIHLYPYIYIYLYQYFLHIYIGKGDIGELSYNKSGKTSRTPGIKTKFGKIVGNKVKVRKIEQSIRRERNEKKYRDE
jgi:hypothetical protein